MASCARLAGQALPETERKSARALTKKLSGQAKDEGTLKSDINTLFMEATGKHAK